MEQLWTCPISLENPTCQNLWCISKYQLEKMGYGMSLVTLQLNLKFSSKLQKSLCKWEKATWLFFIADLDELSVSKSRGAKKKGPVFLQSQSTALTLEKDWAFHI